MGVAWHLVQGGTEWSETPSRAGQEIQVEVPYGERSMISQLFVRSLTRITFSQVTLNIRIDVLTWTSTLKFGSLKRNTGLRRSAMNWHGKIRRQHHQNCERLAMFQYVVYGTML